ncbi:MAG: Ycf66 family protein [Drouetiella hepatica Uher 2000/2452]|jgi:hypothetical protein|uniref:Ycf66 family protein n=1 Tax=Drouetiella hepatica Uher 2000/2452 TaxID=904376 RepID=A0A951QFU6_9CYAN|nr:Ycf66 family protein [Drouetiella hepatica Uher 2000/2452]
MLAYILALAVGFGSLSLYLSAFLFPEIYRKYDLLWSGLGLFYALVLWICAGRITGSLLLGQMASVALLGGLGWQTLSLRFAQTPVEQRIQLQGDSLQDAVHRQFAQLQTAFKDGSWRIYTANILDRLPAQVADLARVFQGWIEALISTTLMGTTLTDTALKSEEPNNQNSSSEVLDAIQKGAVEESGIIDRPFSPVPQTNSAHSSATTEIAAEWDDLEPEVHPELETVDGNSWDFEMYQSLNQGAEPQAHPKASDERSDPR